MLLWRLLLVFTYQGRVRQYCSEPPLAFPRTEVSKLLKRLTVGQAVPEIPLRISSKLELLRAFVFAKFPYTSAYTHAFVRVCVLPCILAIYNVHDRGAEVLHFSAFILFCRWIYPEHQCFWCYNRPCRISLHWTRDYSTSL